MSGRFRGQAPVARSSVVVGATRRCVPEESTLSHSQEAGDRLVAGGMLAAGLAHELNNPIGSILLAARNAKAAPERVDECLDTILRNARRCADVVRNVLALSRREPAPPEPLDVNPLVDKAVRAASGAAQERRASIDLQLAESLPAVLASPLEIEQAVGNLVRNAIESADSGAHVRVTTARSDDGVTIRVCDDGRGIPPPVRDRVFEPFFTTRQAEGGIGLGLSLVRAVAIECGGSVAFVPCDGAGTQVELALPGTAKRGAE